MIDFTNKEQEIIGEFIFSYNSDILIISDATNLLEVLNNHKLISNEIKESFKDRLNKKDSNVPLELINILDKEISEEQGKLIMKKYFGN